MKLTPAFRHFGLLLLLLCLANCARFMPADPYKNTQSVPVLSVPEGKQRPAVDPSLTVPEGDAKWLDNGHKPPTLPSTSADVPDPTPAETPSKRDE